jgi:hypothetical protein
MSRLRPTPYWVDALLQKMKNKNMRKSITLCLALIGLALQAQNFNPSRNRNLELIFLDQLMPYNKLINIDPSTSPVDTFGILEVLKNANGAYLQGREIENDTIISNWICSINGNQNLVYIIEPNNGDTLQMEHIYRDALGRDSLYQTYLDTSASGNGPLVLSEELRLYYGPNGIDSATTSEPNGGSGLGNDIRYIVYRDAQNEVDSLVADIDSLGTSIPAQTLLYFFSNNALDSINLKNTLSGEIEEQVRVDNNSNGLVENFYIYERDNNNAWSLYDEYRLSANSFFGISEKPSLAFNLFPNPSNGIVNLNNTLPADLSIRNVNGEIIWSQKNISPNSELNLSGLAKGIYMLQIKMSDDSFSTQKLLLK